MIDCFVNAIYLYDDHLVLTLNYKDGAKQITLDDILCSDIGNASRPKGNGYP